MHGIHQIEPKSTDRVLACFSLAVDEAKLVRSLIQAKERARAIRESTPFSERLVCLNREISYLERKLAEVRKQAILL